MKRKPEDTRPFAEKHPKFNFLIGFVLLIAILLSFLAVGIWAGRTLGDIILWLGGLASKLDAVVIVALITGAVSITGVIISSIVAKSIEYKKSRNDYLAKRREKPYGEFVDMIYKVQQNTKKEGSYTEQEMLDDLSKFSKEITLWGSSKVVEKWVKFRENSMNTSETPDNLFILEDIMNEMRKDLGLKKVKKGNLLAFFVNDIKDAMKKSKK